MAISGLQTILLCVFFSMCMSFGPIGIINQFSSPLVIGAIIGIILGQPLQGAALGAHINLVYLGVIVVGGMPPANAIVGTAFAVPFALMGNLGYEAALAMAVPISIALANLRTWVNTGAVFFTQGIYRSIEKRNPNGVLPWAAANMAYQLTVNFIMMFLVLKLGSAVMTETMTNLPTWVANGLSVAGGALPAVGIGLGLMFVGGNGRIWLTIAGFIAAKMLGLSTMGCVLLALAVYVVITCQKISSGELDISLKKEEDGEKRHLLSTKDVFKIVLRMVLIGQWAYDAAKRQAGGILLGMHALMKKLYPKDPVKQCEELEKHDHFFNTNPNINGLITGPVIAMEEERALGNEGITAETIQGFKVGMQGPVAAIGDPIVRGVVSVICRSIGISLVLSGNFIGAVVTYFLEMLINTGLVFITSLLGYKYGGRLVDKLYSTGAAKYFTNVASSIGCVAFGALASSTVKLSTGTLQVVGVVLQETLFDAILPGVLSLSLLLICYTLLKKKKVKPVTLLFLVFLGCFALAAIGILFPVAGW